MQHRPLWYLLVALLIFTSTASASSLTLVENGEPRATLVLGANPTDVDRAAAADLQRYLQKMSGAEVPIEETDKPPAGPAVLIGLSAAVKQLVDPFLDEEHLGGNGYILKSFPNRLVVVGHLAHESEYAFHGTRYAAFALLEELGCRFFNPNPDGEHVPDLPTIAVPALNVVSKPDFEYRGPWNNGRVLPTLTENTKTAWQSWFMKNRLGWVSKIRHGHAYEQWCSSDRYFDQHPEYFSYVRQKGRRIPMTSQEGQLCLSNPEVVQIAVAAARSIFQRNSTERSFSLSANDAEDWCECDRCRALDDPDPAIGVGTRLLHFNNQVAAEVSKTHPGRLFAYLGEYGIHHGGVPVRSDGTVALKAHPQVLNTIVMGKDFCILHGIDDPDCPNNAEYRRRLSRWRQVADNLLIYEWIEPGSRLSTPQTWIIGKRIRYYRDLGGVRGYSGEILGRSPDNDLTLYIVSRMLWDADQDDEAIIQEYFDLYFQEAAEPMEAYYRELNRVGKRPDKHDYVLGFEAFTPEVFNKLFPYLDRARDLARQDIIKRRVQRDRDALRAYQLFMDAHDCCAPWAKQSTPESREQGLSAIKAATDFLEQIADQDILAEDPLRGRLEGVRRRLSDRNLSNDTHASAGRPDTGEELLTVDLGHGVTMQFVRIPAGTFVMGSTATELHRDYDEGPARQVTIGKPFYMGSHEVTQYQYKRVTGDNPSWFQEFNPHHPVENLSWSDADEFCRALSSRIGTQVRLPTEAEWEYACRAGSITPFHIGETISVEEANYDGNGVFGSGRKAEHRQQTVPVGSFPPNAWGLYDMHGNVSEWCRDYYRDSYADAGNVDPKGPGSGQHRIVRGGSWRDFPWQIRSAYRFRNHGGSRLKVTGFRVVVPLDGE